MEVFFYKAACGDAARISYLDKEGKSHHVFIDSGYERTFRDSLKAEIDTISKQGQKIDLWVVSHIHDDHIGGVVCYLKAINKGISTDIVERWLFNPPRITKMKIKKDAISEASSIRQGDLLTAYLLSTKKLATETVTSESDPIEIHEMKFTVLSPDSKKLDALKRKYKNPKTSLEASEFEEFSVAMAAKLRDYHWKADDLDLTKYSEDTNVDNGSSIALLCEFSGKRILWCADAHPAVLVNKLNELGWHQKNPIECDLVKVAHHGSASNNSDELYACIKCCHFVMSVDGTNIHALPTKQCMLRILKNPNRDLANKYIFYFTYDDAILRSIFTVDGHEVFRNLNFEVVYLTGDQKALRF